MPTAGELQILITARDEASRQLEAVGTQVQQLERRVEQSSSGLGTRLAGGVSGVADAMRIIGAVAGAAGDAVGALVDQLRQGFASNTELERATVAFQRYTGSAEAAAATIAALRREAAVSPFNDQEVIAAGRALIAYANGSTDALLDLVRVSEQLAVLDPFQGIQGGVVALQEAMSGSFESLIKRFEIPATLIERLRQEGVPNLEIVKRALEFRGIDAGAIEAYGRSVEGLLSTIQSFGAELRQIATSRLFDALGEAFAHVVALIDRYGEQLRTIAAGVAEVFVRLATAAAQALAPLLGFLDRLLPGFREFAEAEFARPVEQAAEATRKAQPVVEALARTLTLAEARQGLAAATGDLGRLQALATQTAAPVAAINRELGQLGVQAAEIQLGADRIRRGFEDQLRPLERQLELLQNSAEVQRIQAGLATNQALSERLRLTRELQALEAAAGAATDPEAPGLTPRQQAIALALQERRLRLEALDADRQRAPAIQSLQERIAELRRQEQLALDPSERLLETYRDRVAVLQIESQRWQNLKADIDAATASIKAQQDQIAAGPSDAAHQKAIDDAKRRGQEVADAWAKAYTAWIDANGGSLWDALTASFTTWYAAGGKQDVERIGGQIGATLWEGFLKVVTTGPSLGDLIKAWLAGQGEAESRRWIDLLNRRAQDLFGPAAAPGGPLGPPLPAAPLQPVVPPVGGEGAAPVTVGDVTVQVGGVQDPGLADRLKQALTDFLSTFILTGMGTDPGAAAPLPGAGRAP